MQTRTQCKLDPMPPPLFILPKLSRVYTETVGDKWTEYNPKTGDVVRVGKVETKEARA